MMVYDAVHINVLRVPERADTFRVTLNSADLEWAMGDPGHLDTKVTVVMEALDRKGSAVSQNIKTSTLQVATTDGVTPATKTVFLYDAIGAKAPSATVRIVVREEPGGKIGSVNVALGGGDGPPGVSN